MGSFTTIVLENGVPSYVAGRDADHPAAAGRVARMVEQTYQDDGATHNVFDGGDDLVVVDDDGVPVLVWNRLDAKQASDFSDIDFHAFLAAHGARVRRRLIGFQITDLEGINIHGTEDDPFGLASFEVLTDAAVLTAKGWATDLDFLVMEVFEGDVEGPVFVSDLPSPQAAAPIR